MGKTNGELFRQELRGAKQGAYPTSSLVSNPADVQQEDKTPPLTCGRSIAKLNHLPQRDTRGGEASIMPDGFHQTL